MSNQARSSKDKYLARELLLAGRGIEEVAGETGVNVDTVSRINDWLHSRPGRSWVQMKHPEITDVDGVLPHTGGKTAGVASAVAAAPAPAKEQVEQPQPQVVGPGVQEITEMMARIAALRGGGSGMGTTYVPPQEAKPQATFGDPTLTGTFTQPPIFTVPQPQQPTMSTGKRQVAVVQEDGRGGMRIVQRLPADWAPEAPDTIEVAALPAAGKGRGNVNVSPWTLVWYDTSNAEWQQKFHEPYPNGLVGFIEDCVIGYFKSRGRSFMYMEQAGQPGL